MPPMMLAFLGPEEVHRLAPDSPSSARLSGLLSARALFLVLVERALSPEAEDALGRLLDANERATEEDGERAVVYVVPHRGTVSPWSSKATDLARRVGLDVVLRLELGRRYRIEGAGDRGGLLEHARRHLSDRMTEDVVPDFEGLRALFASPPPRPLVVFAPADDPARAVAEGAARLGLALDPEERAALAAHYGRLGRAPTDAELMTFAQINSEHCRHKHFRTPWRLADGTTRTLFSCITATHDAHPGPVLVAYRDNAAVLRGTRSRLPFAPGAGRVYRAPPLLRHAVVKAETHNHPTAIEPFAGAATGGGGEIRDESATGRGGRPSMGFVGFITSHLCLPGAGAPWERGALPPPERLADARTIMRRAPLGAAAYGNEFGRPTLAGFFRTFEEPDPAAPGLVRGYHKPVLIAGGSGYITEASWRKGRVSPGQKIVVLGGPGYRIGLGGGSLSSQGAGHAEEALDYASVQRGNPEMERRAQEVIDALSGGDAPNPIVAVHDVGAGGLANAVTELVAEGGFGAEIDTDAIPRDDPSLGPMELWCNEAQERYVLALEEGDLPRLREAAARERCPWAVLGTVSPEPRILLADREGRRAVDLPLAVLFPPPASTPRALPEPPRPPRAAAAASVATGEIPELLNRVLRAPAVADKSFLVTIADRSVGGRTARDPMVGPYQVAVADVAVQCDDLRGRRGRAMALGERPPVALLDPEAASRLALAEALLNLAAADVPALPEVALSANWMAARGTPEEDRALFRAVSALGDFARALGIPIPVGKDSLSMETLWTVRDETGATRRTVRSPVTLVVSAFAPVRDAGRTLLPLWPATGEGTLLLLAPGGDCRLGGSVLETVRGRVEGEGWGALGAPPDVDPAPLAALFALVRRLARRGLLRAYHDRSDGGLAVALLEMAFASARGLEVRLPAGVDPVSALFSEEPGAVVEVAPEEVPRVLRAARRAGLHAGVVGHPRDDTRVRILHSDGRLLHEEPLEALRGAWSDLSRRMRELRDTPESARAAFAAELRAAARDPGAGLAVRLPPGFGAEPALSRGRGRRPRVGILREEGTNGHLELTEAFARAGFAPVDLPMSELHRRPGLLARVDALAAGGGFSYGDVLGAGRGWALALARDPRLRRALARFLADPGTLALGICNGCQMFAALADFTRGEGLLPGVEGWPIFVANRSRRFESRWVNLAVRAGSGSTLATPWLAGMDGALLPVPVAHGEGRAVVRAGRYEPNDPLEPNHRRIVLRYADARGTMAGQGDYPANPNGSLGGVAGLVNDDGRILVLMPHPERAFRTLQYSWHPPEWGEDAPWLRLFRNARAHVLGRRGER